MKEWYDINLVGVDILEQLRIEEALLRTSTKNYFLLNTGTKPAIVLGLSNQVDELVDLPYARKFGIPLIRRGSGGGTVVVDQETVLVSWIMQQETIQEASPETLLAWTKDLIAPVFSPHSLEVSGHDYVLYGKKIGGSAQSFGSGRMVHHSSFLFSWDRRLMESLKIPQHQPAYRAGRPHHEFCGRLSSYFPSLHAFREALYQEVTRRCHCMPMAHEDLHELMRREHRKTVCLLRT